MSTDDRPNGIPPAERMTDYHLEAYKLLADMLKQEESIFWTRNQTLLTLNSALAVILVGILTLHGKEGSPSAPMTVQSAPAPAGQPMPITIQQIVNQPAAPAGPGATTLRLPLVAVCAVGAALCFLWTFLVKRAQGINDYFVIHMRFLEENHLTDIENMRMYDKLFTTETDKTRIRQPKFLSDTMSVDELTVTDAKGERETPRLPRWGTFARIFSAWLSIAVIFIVLWILLGAWILFR